MKQRDLIRHLEAHDSNRGCEDSILPTRRTVLASTAAVAMTSVKVASAAMPIMEWPLERRISSGRAIVQAQVWELLTIPAVEGSELVRFYKITVQRILFAGDLQSQPPWHLQKGEALYGLNMPITSARYAERYMAHVGRRVILILMGTDVASRSLRGEHLPVYRGGNFLNDIPISMNRLLEVSQIALQVGLAKVEEADKE